MKGKISGAYICQYKQFVLYPQQGVPTLYYNQCNVIAKHIAEMKLNDDQKNITHQKYLNNIQPKIYILKSTNAMRC